MIAASFRTIWAIELLVLVMKVRGQDWSEAELVRDLRASSGAVRQCVMELVSAGLLVTDRAGRMSYRPQTEALATTADRLVRIYEQSPTSIMKAIVSAPDDRIRTFADAFRFKK